MNESPQDDLILEVRHLNSYYENEHPGHMLFRRQEDHQQVLCDVSFEIRQGDILGLVGESGSGKTTLAKVILGIVKDYDGELKIVDVNIRRLRLKVEDDPQNPTCITTVWGYGYKWGI